MERFQLQHQRKLGGSRQLMFDDVTGYLDRRGKWKTHTLNLDQGITGERLAPVVEAKSSFAGIVMNPSLFFGWGSKLPMPGRKNVAGDTE